MATFADAEPTPSDGHPTILFIGRHEERKGLEVLLEAMAAGTPIVASDLPGYRNVARPGVDALLSEPGDAAALARNLLAVLGDADRASALVTSGRARADGFSMDRLADVYLGLYARVLDGVRGPSGVGV